MTDELIPRGQRDQQFSDPYPGPRPFRPDEHPLFFGRDLESRGVLDLILSYQVVVLYSQSGAGKTSLVNAGLSPVLSKEGLEGFHIARVGGELPPGVEASQIRNIYAFNALSSVFGSAAEQAKILSSDLSGFLSGGRTGKPRLIIFDQFEELFTAFPERWEERDDFFRQVRDALRADEDLRILFVIREDHLAELDRYADFLPQALRIRYRLERLREKAALDAIVKPIELQGYKFDSGVAEDLVADLRKVRIQRRIPDKTETLEIKGEFVEPVHLQVVCQNLWANLPKETKIITSAHVEIFADVNRALASFYDRAVSRAVSEAKVEELKLRLWFDSQLITPAGTRGIVYKGERKTSGIPNTAIKVLEKEHVIRAEPRAGSTWYELTHDRFIEPIRVSNQIWIWAREHRKTRRNWGAIFGAVSVAFIALYSFGSKYWQDRTQLRLGREARLEFLLGDMDLLRNGWDSAIAHYNTALAKYNELKDKEGQGRVYTKIGEILYSKGEARTASENLQRALAIYKDLGAPGQQAGVLADLGVTYATLGQSQAANLYFQQATTVGPWETIKALDRGIRIARQRQDPALTYLRISRRDILKNVGPRLDSSPDLKAYVCLHNAFVIGASERQQAAGEERQRFLPDFPLAEIGEPSARKPKYVPIIIDFFLTCEEAKTVIDGVQAKYKSNPFVGSWYRGCPRCEELPGRFGE